MVSVATGSGSGSTERLPGLFELPKFHAPDCAHVSNSMLGFGDVLLPGNCSEVNEKLQKLLK